MARIVDRIAHQILEKTEGAAGTVLLGIFLLGEPASAGRVLSLSLIVAGIIGLKLVTPG